MQMTFRWYGEGNDKISLADIKQIPGVQGIVWALHDKMPGEIWQPEEIAEVKAQLDAYGFNMDVVESVNVHDDIKIGLPTRDAYIENYKQTIRNLAPFGVKVTNTKLYGFYKPIKAIFGDKVQMIRHVFTPSVSYSLTPDFGDSKYGYYKSYTYTDAQGEVRTVDYSPYAGSLYGVPGKGRSGSINMDVSNNVEMKVKTDRDSTGVRKISLIDELGGSISYNMAAKSKPWSNLSTRIRLKLTKNYTFSLNSVWATYAYEYNESGRVVVGDRTEWSYGRFGRFQGMSQNFSYTFNNGTWKKWQEKFDKLFSSKEDEEDAAAQPGTGAQSAPNKGERKSNSSNSKNGKIELDEDGYMAYKIPWSFSVSYGVSMRENTAAKINEKNMRYPYKLTQNMNFSGNVKISNKWNMNFSSGWDFDDKELTTTTMNISRDLHCFSMSCGVVLKPYTSYNFSIRANSAMLADALKYDQRSSAGGNVDWY